MPAYLDAERRTFSSHLKTWDGPGEGPVSCGNFGTTNVDGSLVDVGFFSPAHTGRRVLAGLAAVVAVGLTAWVGSPLDSDSPEEGAATLGGVAAPVADDSRNRLTVLRRRRG